MRYRIHKGYICRFETEQEESDYMNSNGGLYSQVFDHFPTEEEYYQFVNNFNVWEK